MHDFLFTDVIISVDHLPAFVGFIEAFYSPGVLMIKMHSVLVGLQQEIPLLFTVISNGELINGWWPIPDY